MINLDNTDKTIFFVRSFVRS